MPPHARFHPITWLEPAISTAPIDPITIRRLRSSCGIIGIRQGYVPSATNLPIKKCTAHRVSTTIVAARHITTVTTRKLTTRILYVDALYAIADRTTNTRLTALNSTRRNEEITHEPVDCSTFRLRLDEGLDFDDPFDSVTGGRNICDLSGIRNPEDPFQDVFCICVQFGLDWPQAGAPPSGHDSQDDSNLHSRTSSLWDPSLQFRFRTLLGRRRQSSELAQSRSLLAYLSAFCGRQLTLL